MSLRACLLSRLLPQQPPPPARIRTLRGRARCAAGGDEAAPAVGVPLAVLGAANKEEAGGDRGFASSLWWTSGWWGREALAPPAGSDSVRWLLHASDPSLNQSLISEVRWLLHTSHRA